MDFLEDLVFFAAIVAGGGQPVHLTPREYTLLQFLAYHRGQVVSRSMIWEHLYNDEDENTSNVVDVYIRYLRNKIDKGFDPPLILTRWGAIKTLEAIGPAAKDALPALTKLAADPDLTVSTAATAALKRISRKQ